MFRILIAAAAGLLSCGTASAWEAFVEGPDVFGTTKALVSEGTRRDGMAIQCDSKGMMAFAYIFRKKEFEDVAETPASLFVQTDKKAPPARLDATMRAWNDNFGGVVVTGVSPELMDVIRSIGAASGRIGVGFEARGNRWSAEFSSRGSTSAIAKLLKACNLENGGLPPA